MGRECLLGFPALLEALDSVKATGPVLPGGVSPVAPGGTVPSYKERMERRKAPRVFLYPPLIPSLELSEKMDNNNDKIHLEGMVKIPL